MSTYIIAYVPVLHDGYRRFFERHPDADGVYVLSEEVLAAFDYIHRKDIRRLAPEAMVEALRTLSIGASVDVATDETLSKLAREDATFIFPKEDVSRQIAEKYFPRHQVVYDDVFLRWDKHNTVTQQELDPDEKITQEQFDRDVLARGDELAQSASDWYRQIGALIVKDGEVIMSARNHHVPSDHQPYMDGDPRSTLFKGVHIELSTVLHAEAGLVAEAARRGISLDGASMYVTTFPCPPCAKQVAYAGIKKLYYRDGYAVLDGKRILTDNGVEIIRVT